MSRKIFPKINWQRFFCIRTGHQHDGIPIFLGYLAVSFAFGIQAADIDLSPFQAGLLSLLNVTSAGQFAGLTVIASAGSYIELAVLQLIVNLRYLLMSAALSQKLPGDTPTIHRMRSEEHTSELQSRI